MGKKIKIKDIEGDSEAISALFASSDCSLLDYLNDSKTPRNNCKYIFILATSYVLSLTFLWSLPISFIILRKFLIIVSIVILAVVVIFIHLSWKNIISTLIGLSIASILFLMAIDVISPKKAINIIRCEGQKIISSK